MINFESQCCPGRLQLPVGEPAHDGAGFDLSGGDLCAGGPQGVSPPGGGNGGHEGEGKAAVRGQRLGRGLAGGAPQQGAGAAPQVGRVLHGREVPP